MRKRNLMRRMRLIAAITGGLLIAGVTVAVAAPLPNPDPCDAVFKSASVANLQKYEKCRLDRLEAGIPGNQTVTVTAPPVTVTATATSIAPSTAVTSSSAAPTTVAPSSTTPPSPPVDGWPDATNTGVAQCPALEKVDNPDTINITAAGTFENKELLNPATINVKTSNVTIRCVKMNGTGYFGIDGYQMGSWTPTGSATSLIIDQVDITCGWAGTIGVLAHSVTASRMNVYGCDHMMNSGDNDVIIRDSYCHDLNTQESVHADCIQSLGGTTNLRIEHNALWSRDTSDVLLGQNYGDATNVVVTNNRLMSIGSPPPAYLLYISGTNTVVTNNRFTRQYGYGPCALNTTNPVTWSGNVWDDNDEPLELSAC